VIYQYELKITSKLHNFTQETISNKTVTARQTDPPWMHNQKMSQSAKEHTIKLKSQTIHIIFISSKEIKQHLKLIRNVLTNHNSKLAEKLKSNNLTSSGIMKNGKY
jgi:hypothetical protein